MTTALASPPVAGTSSTIFINEIHYDNAGTDTGEFIEIAGPAGTNLSGYSIVLYNGSNGAIYDTDPLSGVILGQQGGYGTVSISYPQDGIQNGSPDGIALVGPGNSLVQFLCYEGTFQAVGGAANGQTCTNIVVTEGTPTPVGHSLQLTGTGTTYGDFTWAAAQLNTQNNVNTGQTFTGGGGDSAPIVSSTTPANGATNVAPGADISVTFSESVNAQNSSFSIECPASTPQQAFTLSSSPSSTFTLNPNADLPASTTCTVTVVASQITDADSDDGPDQMAANYSFSFTTASPVVATNVIINELDSDTLGNTDTAEFVELYDGGVGNTPLNGLVVVFFNGNGDTSYAAFDLDGQTTNSQGYFTLGNPGVAGADIIFNPGASGLQNGQDAVALYSANGSNFPNGAAVTTSNLIDAVVYGTDDPDDPGLQVLLNTGESQVNENAGGGGASNSIQRCPNGSGGARDTSAYTARTPTPDGTNNCPPPPVARTIPEIQGDANASPYVGTNVITSGIVTLLKSNGFFLQTTDADAIAEGNPATSQGIFVFTSSAPSVVVGNGVTVTGQVDEFFNLTQVRAQASGITVNSLVNALPTPVTFNASLPDPDGALDQLERFESMRVQAAALVAVSPTNGFGETFTVVQGVARPFREEGIEISHTLPPGTPCCVPRFDENPERIMIDSDGRLGSTEINVTSGVTFTGVTGPLDFTFDEYKIVPEATPVVTANASATPVPVPSAEEFTVASFNLLNFNSATDAVRLNKASLAIRNVMRSPDIIGVQEVLNLTVLQALASKLNADTQAETGINPNYVAYLEEGNDPDRDVGFLVKESRVKNVTVTQVGKFDTFTNPDGSTDQINDRPPLILRGDVARPGVNTSLPVTVIVNHLRSLNDIADDTTADGDPISGPRVRAKRRAQAEFLANLVQSLQSENLILVGDFNAFNVSDGYVDVMGTVRGAPTPENQVVLASQDLVNPNLTDLVDTLSPDQRYSYVFDGNAQVLDHVLVDPDMLALLSRFAYARNNADFPETPFFNDGSRPERVSDHDMPVAYFNLPAPSANLSLTKTASPGTVVTGSDVTYTINVSNGGLDAAQSVVITDALPAGTTFVSCNATGGGVCGGTGNNRTVSYSSLPAGESRTITLVATVDCAVANNTVITNTATVNSDTHDPDTDNNSGSASITASNPAPTITGVGVDKPVLSPPNHKMVDVTVSYNVADNCGDVATSLSVTSNEAVNGNGDGNTAPDWEVVDAHHVRLRAERSGNGNGRIYTITITATDSAGNTSSQTVQVSVPKGNK